MDKKTYSIILDFFNSMAPFSHFHFLLLLLQLLNRANTLTVMTDIKNEEAGEKKELELY